MAGAFGFEKGEHYAVSMQCGERVLLPEVRRAQKDTLIVADGFSCREQIAQETDRHALHLSQVLHMALSQDQDASKEYPEKALIAPAPEEKRYSALRTAAVLGIGAILIGAVCLTPRPPSLLRLLRRQGRG